MTLISILRDALTFNRKKTCILIREYESHDTRQASANRFMYKAISYDCMMTLFITLVSTAPDELGILINVNVRKLVVMPAICGQ